jgi:hypothetical protein
LTLADRRSGRNAALGGFCPAIGIPAVDLRRPAHGAVRRGPISLFWSERSAEAAPFGKPLLVLAAVGAAVVGVAAAGFGVATFLMLFFLFAVVEKRSVLKSAIVSAATAAALILIFRTWLGVPLPAGPLGI